MNLCDRNEIQELLQRHGFRFSKSMGQNFLIESWGRSIAPPPAAPTDRPVCWRSVPASAP